MTDKTTEGLTLRDKFAAQAMVGLITKYGNDEQLAKVSYLIAEAMLRERKEATVKSDD